jgi:RHS repeat-associated protein
VVYYLHGDHPSASLRTSLGSTSLTTDQSGAPVAETRYLPYGEERWTSGGVVSDYTFTGQRAEAGFRLMDYSARHYDPRLGRFVSADTLVPEPGNPQSLNRYSYVNNSPLRFNDPTGHSRPLPPCSICQVEIDTSNWSDLAKGLAVPLSFLTGFHADREQNLVTGPTEQEWMESSLTNMVTPIGMVSMPVERVTSEIVEEGAQQLSQSLTREQVIQSLGETMSPYLPHIREIGGNDARIGFRGSLARGTVGNRRKVTFGQPINLSDFDVDAFVVSDELAGLGKWGDQIPELYELQANIREALGDMPEFQGLRPGDKGFSFRIFTSEEAQRLFGGEEMYFIGNR